MSQGGDPIQLRLARRFYAARIERDRVFHETRFHQPAWSLMLDLYIAHHEGRIVNTCAACVGAQVPSSTAHKWLERMEQAGLIARKPCDYDSRFLLVELTADAMARMEKLLTRLARELGRELAASDRAGQAS